jgi:hypothetical protein
VVHVETRFADACRTNLMEQFMPVFQHLVGW